MTRPPRRRAIWIAAVPTPLAGRVDEYPVALRDVSSFGQSVPASAEDGLHRGSVLERDVIGHRNERPRRGDNKLGVAARNLDTEHRELLTVLVLSLRTPTALAAVKLR